MAIEYLTNPDSHFTDLYIALRKKENRFYIDGQIRELPEISRKHTHHGEWRCRKKSAARFLSYLDKKDKPLQILDIGCGNGWFSNMISNVSETEVLAIDVNIIELEQADRIFSKSNLSFAYADVFENSDLYNRKFDFVVFNSCLQYFQNLQDLFDKVRLLLSETGEIHIIDSPFYSRDNTEKARLRTVNYYGNLGFPEMAENYFHHDHQSLGKHEIMYKPSFFTRLFKNDSPFCWLKIDSN